MKRYAAPVRGGEVEEEWPSGLGGAGFEIWRSLVQILQPNAGFVLGCLVSNFSTALCIHATGQPPSSWVS